MALLIKLAWGQDADKNLPLPTFQTPGSAGADVCANFGLSQRSLEIKPGARALIPTGFSLEIPNNYEIQIRPRSGLAINHGITILNSPGTIDSDYRGLIGIILINHGHEIYKILHGDRIAQMIVSPISPALFETTDQLLESSRGAGGFGSTGKK